MLKTYVTIYVLNGDKIRGCDKYTVRWRDFPSLMEDYFEQCRWAQLEFDVVDLSDEEFELRCHGY